MTQASMLEHVPPSQTSPPDPTSGYQPQIQALRAVAVLSVILYHLWPNHLSGGYAGVDVFFVLSGYLMTKTILHVRTGRGLGAMMREFYARRVSRILPAAVLTLLLCAVFVMLGLTLVEWDKNLHEILASGFFVENWYLAQNATDYLNAGSGSTVQHFWSLSVEEQFYVVWPIIVFFAAKAGPRLTERGRVAKLLAVFGSLTLVSFVYSIYETSAHSAPAYFNTGTRFWELSFGGVLYAVDRYVRLGRGPRAALGWVGLGLIGYALLTFTANTAFPGWHAGIPVLGAGLTVLCSSDTPRWGPRVLLSLRPAQWIGDISYSMYLVHWPLLILCTGALNHGNPLGRDAKLALLPVIVLLSMLMKRFVEDAFRRSRAVAAPRGKRAAVAVRGSSVRRTISVVLAMQIVIVLLVNGGLWHRTQVVNRATSAAAAFQASPERQQRCFDAISAGRSDRACPQPGDNVMAVVPSPLIAADDWPYGRCQERGDAATGLRCDLVTDGTGPLIVVAGDSHITQWLPAILPWATARGMRVSTFLKSGCPLTDTAIWGSSCKAWNGQVMAQLRTLKPTYVFTSALSAMAANEVSRKIAGLVPRWTEIEREGAQIVAFRDVPQPRVAGIPNMPKCLIDKGKFAKCHFTQSSGLKWDIVIPAASKVDGVKTVDLGDMFCPSGDCQPMIDGVLTYIDYGHISSSFSKGLSKALGTRLDAVIGA